MNRYNNLILGFNTFLPDGYKIELPHDGEDVHMTVHTPADVHGGGHSLVENFTSTGECRNSKNSSS